LKDIKLRASGLRKEEKLS